MKTLTPKMKTRLQREKEVREIYEKLHPKTMVRTKFYPPKNKDVLILPEDFSGKDLKRAKKLMRGR